jgi:hypothetical protein
LFMTKNILKSKTVWGAVVAIGGGLLGLGADDVSAVTDTIPQVIDAISTLATIGGGLFAIYGRVHATKEVTVAPKPKAK